MERQKDLFVGMTSHELKTPLAALRGTLQLVQRRLKRVVTTVDHVSPEIHTFFDRLTKNLEGFGPTSGCPNPFDQRSAGYFAHHREYLDAGARAW